MQHAMMFVMIVGLEYVVFDVPIVWSCNACGRHLPSTHRLHAFDDTCQWTHAAQRQRGYEKAPAVLREPTVPPAKAPTAAVEEIIEPPVKVAGMEWIPVTCVKILATLDICQSHDGWHKISQDAVAVTTTNARQLRSTEPRFDAATFPTRSSFGWFPESPHTHGQWWQLENRVPCKIVFLGLAIPFLVIIFHRVESAPTENNTREDEKIIKNTLCSWSILISTG